MTRAFLCDSVTQWLKTKEMSSRLAIALTLAFAVACSTAPPPPAGPAAGSGDAAFSALAAGILEDYFKRHPSSATDLGIHKYDAEMDDASAKAVADESAALTGFLSRLNESTPRPCRSTNSSTANSSSAP